MAGIQFAPMSKASYILKGRGQLQVDHSHASKASATRASKHKSHHHHDSLSLSPSSSESSLSSSPSSSSSSPSVSPPLSPRTSSLRRSLTRARYMASKAAAATRAPTTTASAADCQRQMDEIWSKYDLYEKRMLSAESECQRLRVHADRLVGELSESTRRQGKLIEEAHASKEERRKLEDANKSLQLEVHRLRLSKGASEKAAKSARVRIGQSLDRLKEEFVAVVHEWKKAAKKAQQEAAMLRDENEQLKQSIGCYHSQIQRTGASLSELAGDVERSKQMAEEQRREREIIIQETINREKEIERQIRLLADNVKAQEDERLRDRLAADERRQRPFRFEANLHKIRRKKNSERKEDERDQTIETQGDHSFDTEPIESKDD